MTCSVGRSVALWKHFSIWIGITSDSVHDMVASIKSYLYGIVVISDCLKTAADLVDWTRKRRWFHSLTVNPTGISGQTTSPNPQQVHLRWGLMYHNTIKIFCWCGENPWTSLGNCVRLLQELLPFKNGKHNSERASSINRVITPLRMPFELHFEFGDFFCVFFLELNQCERS